MPRIKMHAPFYVKKTDSTLTHVWKWVVFETDTSNTHAACRAHAEQIDASSWDPSQASVMINGNVVCGNPTVFR